MIGKSTPPDLGIAAATFLLALWLGNGDPWSFCAWTLLAWLGMGQPILAVLAFAIAGWALSSTPPNSPPMPDARRVELIGTVQTPSRDAGYDRQRTWLRDVRSAVGGDQIAEGLWLIEPATHPRRERGELLHIEGWARGPQGVRNPGDSPRKDGEVRVSHAGQVRWQGNDTDLWTRLRRGLDQLANRGVIQLQTHLSPDAASLLAALLFGTTDSISKSWKSRLRDTGSYHLVAVSGMHVLLVAATLTWLLQRVGKRGATLQPLIPWGVFLYALMTGGRPPAMRASLGFSLWWWRQRHRPDASIKALIPTTLLVVACLQPEEITTASFCLSFAAVVGLSTAFASRPSLSPRGTGTGVKLLRPLMRGLWISWGATLATAPWTAFHFGTWTPWSPLTHGLLAPLLLPLMAGGVCTLLFPALFPWTTEPLASLLHGLVWCMDVVLNAMACLPATPCRVSPPSSLVMLLLTASLLCLWWKRPLASTLLGVLALLLLVHEEPDAATLTMLDVGHGQCVVMQVERKIHVIDAGTGGSRAISSSALLRSMAALDVARIDTLFLTHLDRDHAGLAESLVADSPPETLFLSSAHQSQWQQARTNANWLGDLVRQVEAKQIPVRFLHAGDQVEGFEVLWPPQHRRFLSNNEGSLALLHGTQGQRVLFPGDLESFPLGELAFQVPFLDTLILPHHGNPCEFLGAILDHARPLVAWASRDSALPQVTLDALSDYGAAALSTRECGALRQSLTGPHGWRRAPKMW